jgi:hypothetical protein
MTSGATACASTSGGNEALFTAVSSSWGDRVDPDPARPELYIEDADQMDQGGFTHAIGRHAGGRL